MADVTIKQGDTAPSLAATLEDGAGNAVSLVGATVRFRMKPIGGGSLVMDGAAVVVSAAAGTVRYDWQATDTQTAGLYLGEFEADFGAGQVQSFPNDSPGLVVHVVEQVA